MNNKGRNASAERRYAAPVLELHEFRVEQGFANSGGNGYLEIGKGDYNEGPGFGGGDYNDLDF